MVQNIHTNWIMYICNLYLYRLKNKHIFVKPKFWSYKSLYNILFSRFYKNYHQRFRRW